MVRLDKFLCDCQMGSRSQIKDWIRLGLVKVNGEVIKKPEQKIDENTDEVFLRERVCENRSLVYYMLNKPAGVVSATRDNTADTVLSLLKDVPYKDLFPVGRLDKDTTGLLLITNDGDLSHRLLSPKRHVDKTYLVALRNKFTADAKRTLEIGVDIGDDKPTLPAKVECLDDMTIKLSIHEGRFHQVKRMLQAVGNEVTSLKRLSFGPLYLDDSLPEGEYRPLLEEEVESLKAAVGIK